MPKRLLVVLVCEAAFLTLVAVADAQVRFDVLHAFPAAGAVRPVASLIQGSDGSFYGTTPMVACCTGVGNRGTVFRITPDGTLTVLHSFTGGTDGGDPEAALVLGSDGNFYGTTAVGGSRSGGLGTIFKLTPSGTLTTLHAFTGGTDGGNPNAALIQASDGNFYGTTRNGGTSGLGLGTVFKMTPAGAVTVLHAFADAGSDGSAPSAALVQGSDGNFYGTTASTAFQMTAAGVVTTLHVFTGSDGYAPAALTQGTDGSLYGTTQCCGAQGGGLAFKITTTGTFTVLHTFHDTTEVSYPYAGLVQMADGNFIGVTSGFIPDGKGAAFTMTPSGAVTVLHTFNGTDGAMPQAALLRATDGSYYGTTRRGGTFNAGTIFRMSPAGVVTTLHSCTGGTDGTFPGAGLIQARDGYLYGSTVSGGGSDGGTVFKIAPTGSAAVVYAFAFGAGREGYHPATPLVQAMDGSFFGTTTGLGTALTPVFKLTPAGSGATVVAVGQYLQGSVKSGLMQASDGNLYGTVSYANEEVITDVFQLTPAGSSRVFGATYPGDPSGRWLGNVTASALIQASDGNFYFTTRNAFTSSTGSGAIVQVTPAGTATRLYSFTGGADGGIPFGALVLATDGSFYGTASVGGAGFGTVFKITMAGAFSVVHSFSGTSDGADPEAALIQASNGNFYGTTRSGGAFGFGTVFEMTPGGTVTVLHSFTGGADGSGPTSGLVQAPDGRFYGTTPAGGASATGVVYRLVLPVSRPLVRVDVPANHATVLNGAFTLAGWAVDFGAASGTGIDQIHVWATPTGGSQQFVGAATYGVTRPDVGALLGSQFTDSGYSLTVTGLTTGTSYTLTAYGHSTVAGLFSVAGSIDIKVAPSQPFMRIDTPINMSQVGHGSFTVAGWAIDFSASDGPGTDLIHIYAFPAAGPPVFLGEAARTDRPDIASFGSRLLRSGFTLNVPSGTLAPGNYQLIVYARSTVTRTFNGTAISVIVRADDSYPELYIDTPSGGTRIGNSLTIAGWAIDRGAPSGTGVTAIDIHALPASGAAGTFLGRATYGLTRPDIGSLLGLQFTSSGYSLTANTSGLAPGNYTIVVFGYSTVTNGFTFARAITATK